jgi:ComF family protein
MNLPRLKDQLADLVYPSSCAACGRPCVRAICGPCFAATCEQTALTDVDPGIISAPVSFLGVRAAGDYKEHVKDMVLRLKASERRVARPLASLMLAAAGNDPRYIFPAAVCFVPSARRKTAERGYNPAEVLAGLIASMLGRPLVDALVVSRKTADQDSVPGAARWSNVVGAFAARTQLALTGSVLLIDDVFTTGATADACSSLLLGQGASEVSVLVAARAVRRNHPYGCSGREMP